MLIQRSDVFLCFVWSTFLEEGAFLIGSLYTRNDHRDLYKEGLDAGFHFYNFIIQTHQGLTLFLSPVSREECAESDRCEKDTAAVIHCVFVGHYIFLCVCLRLVFVAARGLSPVVASGGYSSLPCAGFSLRWLLLLQNTGSRCAGFSSCGTRPQ